MALADIGGDGVECSARRGNGAWVALGGKPALAACVADVPRNTIMLSLLWIIPVSLGITWLCWKLLWISGLFIRGVFEWFWSPVGQRALDRGITGAVFGLMVVMVLVIVLRVATV